MPRTTQLYGIDTSIFVRLLTGHPKEDFEANLSALEALRESEPASALMVSNQVIGEAYITLQFHYKISKPEARSAIRTLFKSGIVAPLNGESVEALLQIEGGAGLMDRLIADDYKHQDAFVLTNDRRMASLAGCRLLKKKG